MLNKILSIFPWLEVLIRVSFWKSRVLNKVINKFVSAKKPSKSQGAANFDQEFSGLLNKLKDMGIEEGDTIIVHSAYGKLKGFGLSPQQIIDALTQFVGEKGNLIMPAIPILNGQPSLLDRFDLCNYTKTPVYDVKKSKCWTGLLAQTLLKMPGALRSRSPLNSMVVYGANASTLIRNDLFSKDSLPCGPNSALANSIEYNSKMVFLGVDEVHNMTMIHVVEDLYIKEWPIKNWFWKRPFEIVDGEYHETVVLEERNPFWALFYAERKFSRDLLKDNIVRRQFIGDLSVSVSETSKLINYLREKNAKGYPYCIPFWYRGGKNANN